MSESARGRDVIAPIEHITIEDITYKLVYNNHAARVAEDVYEEFYSKDVGYAVILQEIAKGKLRAAMALFYGAMIAGGSAMTWPEFDAKFKLDSVEGIREIVMRGVSKSLPKAKPGDKAKDP